MKSILTTLLVLLLSVVAATAQFARVQILHNAPDPTVDVYVNGIQALNDFSFRSATPFLDLPAGISLTVAVAPASSTSAMDAIATFPLTLEAGRTYAITASGIVGDMSTPFTLIADDNAQETAVNPAKVALNILHGSPDAPAVDVVVRTGGKIVSNLAYGEFTPYLEVDPGVYYLDIKPAGTNTIVQTYRADLSGLAGQALRVFASGLLNGTPAFGLYAALPNGATVEIPASPVARVQVIHNSPSPTVDVWANSDLLLDDFTYRSATPFIFVPAGVNIDLGIAPDTSTTSASAIANFPVNLENGKTYIVTASGIVGDPTTPFTLILNDAGRETAADTGSVDVAVLHGSTNAPAVDVDAVFVADNVISNLAYGAFTPYLSLSPEPYDFAIRAAGDPNVVASFRADLSGLKGAAAYVFASGLLGGSPAFGLFAALPNGAVVELPLTPTARLQVIHNSPEPTVDVYAGNTLLLNDFAFRTATPFIDVPADRDIQLGVAPANSSSSADAIATFEVNLASGSTYAVMATGQVGNTATPFILVPDAAAQEAAADPAKVDFNVQHGSIDAPAVDIDVVGLGTIVPNLAYPGLTPYFSVDPGTYRIQIKPAGSGMVVATFEADLSSLAGGAARVFASGLLNGTPAFGLFAALADGTVVEFPAVPAPATARVQIIHNSPSPTVDIYANDELLLDNFSYRTATPFIDVPANVALNIGVAPGNSSSVNDVIANFPVTLDESKTYIVTASGIVGDPTTPFTLILNDAGRETAADTGSVDVAVLHGSTNAPAVDVDAVFVADNVISNLAYGAFTPYLSLSPEPYDLAIRAAGDPNVVASFRADLSGLKGAAAYVFASGLLGGSPAFGLFAALPNGTVVELPLTPTARLQVIHNSPEPTVDVYAGNTLLLNDFAFRTATPFIDVPANVALNIGVAPGNSNSVNDVIANFPVTLDETKTYIATASGIVGNPTTPFTLILNDAGRETAADNGSVAVAVLHGSTNAPAVDVDAVFVADNVISNLAYGAFTPYLSLSPEPYDFAIRAAGDPNVVASFRADLSGLNGAAAYVFASGLLGGSPAFGLFAALPNGTVVALPLTPTTGVQVIHNSPDPIVDVYAGNTLLINDFTFRTATPLVQLPVGRNITLGIAPGNSSSAGDAIYTLPVAGLETGKTYIVMAAGVVGDPVTPFQLYINENGRAQAQDPAKVDLALFHGAPDAPDVDVQVPGGPVVFDNASFGSFSAYLSLDPAEYVLQITPANDNATIVQSYLANISSLTGQAATAFASGYLNGLPGFEVWVALTDGTSFPLPVFVRTNELDAKLRSLQLAPNPALTETWIRFELTEAENLRYGIRDIAGRLIAEGDWGTVSAGHFAQRLDVSSLNTGMYQLEILSDKGMQVRKFIIQKP